MTPSDARRLDEIVRVAGEPALGHARSFPAAGYHWHALEWGERSASPLVLIHGVTSDSGSFWRLGPALAATGRHVVAIDLPGHGRTARWRGRQRFLETAADVIAAVSTLRIRGRDLTVLGHSWGGMVASALPAAGLKPRTIILLDPPVLTLAELEALSRDPEEQPIADAAEALDGLRRSHPDWDEADVP